MLRRWGIGLALAAALFAAWPSGAAAVSLSSREVALLRAINHVRARNGVRPLEPGPRLQRAARAHTATMLRTGAFYHGALLPRLLSFGVRNRLVGENLAWGSGYLGRPQALVRAWLRSPGHRANLLRPGFARIGIGAKVGRFAGYDGAVVVTADFAGR